MTLGKEHIGLLNGLGLERDPLIQDREIHIRSEYFTPLIGLVNADEILDTHYSSILSTALSDAQYVLTLKENGLIDNHEFLRKEAIRLARFRDETPRIDELTGVYGRRDFFNFLALCMFLGIDNVSATIVDMNHLKDYNKYLGQPTGGDYALVVIANALLSVANKNHQIVFRPQNAGGDDFLILGIPKTEGEFKNTPEEIEAILKTITVEEFFSGKVSGQVINRYASGDSIILDPKRIARLNSDFSSIIPVIIPPSVAAGSYIIHPVTEIQIVPSPSGQPKFKFNTIASNMERALDKLETVKVAALVAKIKLFPNAAGLISRPIKNGNPQTT